MPKDISSSSEDEAGNSTESPVKPKEPEKTSTYECPPDFVTFSHKPCSSTLTENLKKNKSELWLIKAPASFNPEGFSGIKVPLSGFQTLKVPTAVGEGKSGGDQQVYSILASTHGTSELRLLTRKSSLSDGMVFGHAFSGLLNICESYGASSTNQSPQAIPAAPAPSIPLGLKQRFHPFGSKTPTRACVVENEADGADFGPSSTTLCPLVVKRFAEDTPDNEGEEGRKKKKKKKKIKEKRIKAEWGEDELVQVVRVKKEPVEEIADEVMMEVPLQDVDALEERRKKKKKKKDRDREQAEGGAEPRVTVKPQYVTVKCETLDTSYGNVVEDSGKKKKKKKKSKTEDD